MSGSGRIELRDLRASGVHGVLPEERARPQPFSLDLDVWLDVERASASDDIADTADYGALAELAAAAVASTSFSLLEALADEVARRLLEADARILRTRVVVRKIRPPVPVDVRSVGVRVVRRRGAPEQQVRPAE